jgi:hypothetical protein
MSQRFIADASSSAPASAAAVLCYAGFVVFTLGVGDVVAVDGTWQVLTSMASFVGLFPNVHGHLCRLRSTGMWAASRKTRHRTGRRAARSATSTNAAAPATAASAPVVPRLEGIAG